MDDSKVISKLNQHDEQLDRIVGKLVDHDGKLERMENKLENIDEKVSSIDNILAGQDKMIQILTRVDQERVFTNEKIKQLEADVKQIKLHLQIA